IYRFRRADIETYDIVRRRVRESGGRLLTLSTSFRSTPALCGWVNGAFARPGFFPAESTPEQAAHVPLHPERAEPPAGTAVFRLETPASGNADQPVVDCDARRIAGFIAAEVSGGGRRPGDFLVLLRRRKFMADYARALEERRVPYEIAGGDAFGGSEELAALLSLLRTLADPDDPVSCVAVLRGSLFGVDDEALYRFVRAGGRFSHRAELPAQADPRIRRAMELLREGERLVETLPPAAAIARFCDRLGLVAAAAAQPLGDSRAGNLLKALAAARKLSGDGLPFPAIVRALEDLRRENLIEQMGVEPGRADVVRLMTLHGAKGLEAPVVFLADPTRDVPGGRDYWIERGENFARGHFRVVREGEDRGRIEIARPAAWDAMAERESRFEAAEKIRLLYVGATRAKQMLVVSIKRMAAGKAGGPWAALDASLRENLPEPPRIVPVELPTPAAGLSGELAAFRRSLAERRRRCAVATYAASRVTALAHAVAGSPAREDTGRGMEWGRIIHRLLEAAMRDASIDVRALARNFFAEEDRAPGDLEEAVRLVEGVRTSPLWRRALAAKRRLVEVPFARMVASAELGPPSGPPETLLTGAIDLVFEEEDGWTLVDYKSDTVAGNLPELSAFYRPQIEQYRRQWRELTGRQTRAGLFFVSIGEEVWIP
ncbi:MAG: UvrD-helicase domain-containing protein, partial [Thermoanaerobaculia bacterium]